MPKKFYIEDGEAIRTILQEKDMPNTETFYKWLDDDKDKTKQYARACEFRADNIFEDILVISDNQEHDVYTDDDGKEQVNHNVIQRARLRVDSRKWMLGKMNPKKYGEKIDLGLDIKTNIKGITFDKE